MTLRNDVPDVPVTMDIIISKLYASLVKSVYEQFGDEGVNKVEQGVQALLDEQLNDLNKRSSHSYKQLDERARYSIPHLANASEVKETHRAYEQIQKEAGIEPFTIYAMMAKLFAHITKAVVDRFDEDGRQAIREGVRHFGEARGQDIARRAAAKGLPNTAENYLTNYDMGRSDLFEFETTYHPKEIEQTFTVCAFGDQWKKDGTGEHGILYCQMIDPSIAKGYNRNFDVLHDRYVLKEGDCHFRFQMKEDESN
ncbi:L-2-amino-thiazoline-4-carboxylic acid hydrolase [Shouchella miscanthi]|uniref:L-2-amino-thiazoline-4-carboxylic acid hydrolase n=1 Tax=Shouchella miscanthi TaxID=2598861 RepID=A0ABU6NIT3_9BACI|nr:L-2-amino-thiazoline-4-carboxylic acid hydrolase [Shouchella miscanthi]